MPPHPVLRRAAAALAAGLLVGAVGLLSLRSSPPTPPPPQDCPSAAAALADALADDAASFVVAASSEAGLADGPWSAWAEQAGREPGRFDAARLESDPAELRLAVRTFLMWVNQREGAELAPVTAAVREFCGDYTGGDYGSVLAAVADAAAAGEPNPATALLRGVVAGDCADLVYLTGAVTPGAPSDVCTTADALLIERYGVDAVTMFADRSIPTLD